MRQESTLKFNVLWNQEALDSLKRLDKSARKQIFNKVEDHLSQNPIEIGSPLKENMSGMFRYRCGDYRVIYVVSLEKREIIVLDAGHRKDIYSK